MMHYNDVFSEDGTVKDWIVVRREIIQGKQGSRSIPTHENLKKSLLQYVADARELLTIKKIVDQWDEQSLSCSSNRSVDGQPVFHHGSSKILLVYLRSFEKDES